MFITQFFLHQIGIQHDSRHRVVYLMGHSCGETAKACHFFRMHQHLMGLLEVFLYLLQGSQIGEKSKGGDLLVTIIDDTTGKAHRNILAVFVLNYHLLTQKLAFTAKIIGAHPFDQLIGDTVII